MATLQPTRLFPLTQETPVHSRTVTILGIDRLQRAITIVVTGPDIASQPTSLGNEITVSPVNEPNLMIYKLLFEIEESLQSQWRFNQPAVQFFATGVQAGLVVDKDDDTSVTLSFYNAPSQTFAEYQVSLGFLETDNPVPLWIDDPTVILKPPTGSEG